LLKNAPDDLDWQAFPADIRARYGFPRGLVNATAFDAASTAPALRAMRSSSFGEAAAAAGTLA